jgi:hypothetical protein
MKLISQGYAPHITATKITIYFLATNSKAIYYKNINPCSDMTISYGYLFPVCSFVLSADRRR